MNLNHGGDAAVINFVEASASGSVTFSSVIDLGNGQYTANFVASASGAYQVTATVNGVYIASGTLAVSVTSGGGGDTTPPLVGNAGAIFLTGITDQAMTLDWTTASDDQDASPSLVYCIYRSTSPNIATVTDAQMNGIQLGGCTANLSTTWDNGLQPSTMYYYNVVVRDSAGNSAAYSMNNAVTTAFTCDSGDPSTTCIVNTAKTIPNGFNLTDIGTLQIVAGGSLNSLPEQFFNVAMGSLVVQSGGAIHGNVFGSFTTVQVDAGGSIDASGLGYSGGSIGLSGEPQVGHMGGGLSGSYGGGGAGFGDGGGGAFFGGGGFHMVLRDLATPPTGSDLDFGGGGGSSSSGAGGAGGGIVNLTASSRHDHRRHDYVPRGGWDLFCRRRRWRWHDLSRCAEHFRHRRHRGRQRWRCGME